MPSKDDEFRDILRFFEDLIAGPPDRPQHPDFMKLSAIVLEHDGPTTDPTTMENFSMEETIEQVINNESLTYMAMGRAKIFMVEVGLPMDMRVLSALASAWVDAFLVGNEWQRERRDTPE